MSKKKVIKIKNQKKKDNSTRSLVITCIVIIISLIAILSISFAAFQKNIPGKKTTRLQAAIFNVTFDDGNEFIDLNNAGPESDEDGLLNTPYTFTINNDSNVSTTNKIYFSDVESTIPDEYLKFAVKVDASSWSEPKTMAEFDNIIEEAKIIEPDNDVTYSIVFWISNTMPNEDTNGNSLMGTSYKSKITVESTPVNPNSN